MAGIDVYDATTDDVRYDPAGAADTALASAKSYADSISSGLPNSIRLSSFSTSSFTNAAGTTFTGEDARLENAKSYAAAQSHIPLILVDYNVTFNQGKHLTFSGFKISGAPEQGWQNAEQGAGKLVRQSVTLGSGVGTEANSFFVGSGQHFDVYMACMSVGNSGTAQFYHHPLSGTTYCLRVKDMQLNGMKYGFGSPAGSLAITAAVFDGVWTVTNPYNTQFVLGGSDSDLFPQGACNIGPASFITDPASPFYGAGKYLAILNSLGKTNVGGMFFTCDSGWRGMQIAGSADYTAHFGITGARFEGRNAGDPCYGNLLEIANGAVSIRNTWFSYAMSAPATAGFGNPTGYVWIRNTGASGTDAPQVRIRDCTTDRATGVAETVPVVGLDGGELDVTGWMRGTKGSVSWAGRPRVKVSGTGVVANSDYSVTLV